MNHQDQLTAWIKDRPARALKIYYGGGRKAAIEEMCISCVGTAQEAKKCPCTECPLWTFRPGADKNEVPSFVPPEAELKALAESKVSDAVREHARKLGESKRGT
jgi:hypothetical protein